MKNFIVILFFILFSCNKNVNATLSLIKTESLIIPIPNDVFIGELYWDFNIINGYEYISFGDFPLSKINSYNISKKKWNPPVKIEKEGPLGVGIATGFYLHNKDSVYIISGYENNINLFHNDTTKLDRYETPNRYNLNSFTTRKVRSHGDYIYFQGTEYVDYSTIDGSNESYVFLRFNKKTKEFKKIIKYPEEYSNKVWSKEYFNAPYIIRNDKIVISYAKSPYLYIYDLDGNYLYKKEAKSNYIREPKSLNVGDDTTGEKAKNIYYSHGFYGYIFYDEIKKKYYRLCKTLKTNRYNTLEPNQYFKNLSLSIIVLDESFNVLGESEFLDDEVSGYFAFMGSKGLYLSTKPYYNGKEDERQFYILNAL